MNNNSGFSNNALNSRTINADEIYTAYLTATTTTSTIQDFTDLTTDSVNEKTSGSGVMVDDVLLKDGLVDAVDVSALKTDVDGFSNELKSLTADEINQLANIGTTTESATQWGYLGAMNQGLATTDSVTFNNISVVGTVDGVDVALLDTKVTDLVNSSPNQGLDTSDSPTFAGLTTGGNLMMSAAQTSDSTPSSGKIYSRGVIFDSKGASSTYEGDENFALSLRQDRNSSTACGIFVRTAWGVATSIRP